MADAGVKLDRAALAEVSYDGDNDDEVALVAAATEPATDDYAEEEEEAKTPDNDPVMANGGKSEAQVNGVMVLSLLDKIIGVVDQIQHTQNGLEARQEAMEKSVSGIQGELTKLSKSHAGTANTVNKMLDKVRKVSVNVKTVRGNLERQAGQIKKLESNESELLKRRNFKVLIYQDENKTPKASKPKVAEGAALDGRLEQIPEEGGDGCVPVNLHSDEEEVEVEETVEESRAERIKRSGKQRVDNIKKAFSKEKMEKTKLKTKENLEKTKQRTRENLEKTRQRTRENLEKTKHSLEKKMGKLSSRMTPNQERKEKLKGSKEKMTKSMTPDHTVSRRSKMTVYRVPPFTFHVKKIRDGEEEDEEDEEEEVEVVHDAEVNEAPPEDEHLRVEVQEGDLVDVDSPAMKAFLKVAASEGLLDGDDDAIGLEVEVEEGELVSLDGPEMKALLEAAEDSQLVMVEESEHLEKKKKKNRK